MSPVAFKWEKIIKQLLMLGFFFLFRHQDVEAILEAENLVFALMEKVRISHEVLTCSRGLAISKNNFAKFSFQIRQIFYCVFLTFKICYVRRSKTTWRNIYKQFGK